METFECLTKECIILLENNQLLKTLIRTQLGKDIISKVNLEDNLKARIIDEFKRKYNLINEEAFRNWQAEKSITNIQFESLALRETKIKEYCKKNFDHKVDAWFLKRKSQLDIVTYSLIRLKQFHKARELYLRIAEGEADFGDLATRYSEGFESKARGIVGPTQLSNAHPKLIEKIISSKPGKAQPPILIGEFYIVLRVESYEPAQLDEPMRARMQEELFGKWLEDEANLIREKLLANGNSTNN